MVGKMAGKIVRKSPARVGAVRRYVLEIPRPILGGVCAPCRFRTVAPPCSGSGLRRAFPFAGRWSPVLLGGAGGVGGAGRCMGRTWDGRCVCWLWRFGAFCSAAVLRVLVCGASLAIVIRCSHTLAICTLHLPCFRPPIELLTPSPNLLAFLLCLDPNSLASLGPRFSRLLHAHLLTTKSPSLARCCASPSFVNGSNSVSNNRPTPPPGHSIVDRSPPSCASLTTFAIITISSRFYIIPITDLPSLTSSRPESDPGNLETTPSSTSPSSSPATTSTLHSPLTSR